MPFRVVILGGTGQVGAAVVQALLAQPACVEIVMVNRRQAALSADARLRQVVLDTAAPGFSENVAALVREMAAAGQPVFGASCAGVGKGSSGWSEEDLKALELGVVGGFARGCHAGGASRFALLSAAGTAANSRIRYLRIMGLKEETVQSIGFQRLAIFRPGIIGGNAHTPRYLAWIGRFFSGWYGTVEQDDIAGAFVAEFLQPALPSGTVILENAAIRQAAA